MGKYIDELLMKNILCAVSAGMILNVGIVNITFANKLLNKDTNIMSDTLLIEKQKVIANDISNIDRRLSNLTSKKSINNFNKNEVLIDLTDENIFNPNKIIKHQETSLKIENAEKIAEDFEKLNNKNGDSFIKKNKDNKIDENINAIIDKNDTSLTAKDNIEKQIDNIYIEKNASVQAENKENILNIENIDKDALHKQAVLDARAGLYDKSLLVLKSLYASNKNEVLIAYDYMTVLNWAGKYKEAINIYENGKYNDVPDYVKLNIAGAYYRLNMFDKTLETIEPLVKKENKEAILLLAQVYLKENNINQADEIYEDLIEKNPDDITIYLNRAQASTAMANWLRAARDWSTVLNIYEEYPNNAVINKQQILDNLSATYIHMSRYKEAIQLLEPYIYNKTASVNVIGNYIIALNNLNQLKQAEKIYNEYFPKYENTPTFVIREIGSVYIKLRNYRKAMEVYKYLANLPNASLDDKFNFAYYACLSGINKYEGIKFYHDVLQDKNASKHTTKILNQAQDFLRKGYYNLAKDLYYELINYDKRFHNIYAGDLVNERQYQSALHEYYIMTKDSDLKKQGIEGIVQTSVLIKDYKTAENQLEKLNSEFKNEDYDKAKGSFINKQLGEIDFNVFNYSDYDDSNETNINVFLKQYIDDSFWIESSIGKSYIKDVEDNDTTILDIGRVGIRYINRKWDSLLAYSLFDLNSGEKNGLYFETLFKPTDRQSVNFIYSYEPIYDTDALDYENGSIFGDNYFLRYMYDINLSEAYYLELRRSKYTDGNKRYGWEIGQQYNIYNEKEKRGRTLDRNIFWSRDRYSNQEVLYTSPKLSENIGSEWKWGLNLNNNDVIYYILGAKWERDYPDNLSFAPYIGIEYNKYIGDYNFYSISASYGWKTQSWLGEGDWDYDNKQISFSYNITW